MQFLMQLCLYCEAHGIIVFVIEISQSKFLYLRIGLKKNAYCQLHTAVMSCDVRNVTLPQGLSAAGHRDYSGACLHHCCRGCALQSRLCCSAF